jgi:hypothetical protein
MQDLDVVDNEGAAPEQGTGPPTPKAVSNAEL